MASRGSPFHLLSQASSMNDQFASPHEVTNCDFTTGRACASHSLSACIYSGTHKRRRLADKKEAIPDLSRPRMKDGRVNHTAVDPRSPRSYLHSQLFDAKMEWLSKSIAIMASLF